MFIKCFVISSISNQHFVSISGKNSQDVGLVQSTFTDAVLIQGLVELWYLIIDINDSDSDHRCAAELIVRLIIHSNNCQDILWYCLTILQHRKQLSDTYLSPNEIKVHTSGELVVIVPLALSIWNTDMFPHGVQSAHKYHTSSIKQWMVFD